MGVLDVRTDPLPAVRQCAADIATALGKVADAQPVFLDTADKAAVLAELVAIETQVQELRLRVMAVAGDVADATGSHDIAAWLSAHTRVRPAEAKADQGLATALDRRFPVVAAGMRDGAVNTAQARVITRSLDELRTHLAPEGLDADVVARAETHLVGEAARFGPRSLARLARRILDVVAPEVAEAAEARRLAALEASAEEKTRLTIRRNGDGTTRISGVVSDLAGTRLATYLEAFTNPRVARGGEEPSDVVSRLPYPRKLGRAFVQFLESVDPGRLPIHGGDATTLIVTIGLDQLRRDLSAAAVLGTTVVPGTNDPATWDSGDSLTAAQARRLACNAQIIPAVLGSDGEVLDLGRSARLFSKAQRRALALRDKTCRAEGCDAPADWCEAHHLQPWSAGGPTDLANAVLLCSRDHHRAHDPDYRTQRLANGDIRFHRRT